MLTLLGINKLLAIYVGPVGYALVGQFQSAVQMITTFASGAINTGVVRYTAEYAKDENRLKKIWGTSGTIAISLSFITALLIATFNESMAEYFLKDRSFGGVFLWFSAFLPFFVLNTLLLAILNGKKELLSYIVANVSGSILSLILTSIMAIKWQLYGALIALGIFQSISFFITLSLCLRFDWFKLKTLFGKIDLGVARSLTHYTIMALSSAILIPLSHIYIRNLLGRELSWESAGHWEAMWKFSAAFLLFITSTLSVYYLPRISEINNPSELRKEVLNTFRVVLPVVIFGAALIYTIRETIVILLFSVDFLEITVLFFWQLVGDIFKTAGWLLGFILIARGLSVLYIVCEMVYVFVFTLSTTLLIPMFDLEATAISHAFGYFIYLFIVYVSLKLKRVL